MKKAILISLSIAIFATSATVAYASDNIMESVEVENTEIPTEISTESAEKISEIEESEYSAEHLPYVKEDVTEVDINIPENEKDGIKAVNLDTDEEISSDVDESIEETTSERTIEYYKEILDKFNEDYGVNFAFITEDELIANGQNPDEVYGEYLDMTGEEFYNYIYSAYLECVEGGGKV
jgi:hypothetical protein